MIPRAFPVLAAACITALAFAVGAEKYPTTAEVDGGPLMTLDEAVRIALKQNPDIRNALLEIERTRGLVIEVRGEAFPRIAGVGTYNQQDQALLQAPSGNITGSGPTTGTITFLNPDGTTTTATVVADPTANTLQGSSFFRQDKTWRLAVEVRQLLYAGGRVRASINAAEFTRDSAFYSLRQTIDNVIAQVRQQFYQVLLNRAQIGVQEESTRLLESQLKDQQQRFDAGTVPRFNVLRAEVELSNVRPDLIRARNNYRISSLDLARTLAITSPAAQPNKLPLTAAGELVYLPRVFNLADSILLAKQQRPLLKIQRQQILTEVERIKVAQAGYKPQLSVSGGYEMRNSRLTNNLGEQINGWFFGVTGNWNVFDGLETTGRVIQARARLGTAKVTYDDAVRQVVVEVQSAFSRLLEARELNESQTKNVEQAVEALRLANERFNAGAGTQLDVLDARVALTRAQLTQLQARYDYNAALADLDRVTASDSKWKESFDDPMLRGYKPKAEPPPKTAKPQPASTSKKKSP